MKIKVMGLLIVVVVSCIELWENVPSCARESGKKPQSYFFCIHKYQSEAGRVQSCLGVRRDGRCAGLTSEAGQAKAPSETRQIVYGKYEQAS